MMPANKHKRKASAQTKSKGIKGAQTPGLIASYPKSFLFAGLCFLVLGVYLLTFKSQDNAMFGVAMLSLLAGVVTTIYAKFSAPKKKVN